LQSKRSKENDDEKKPTTVDAKINAGLVLAAWHQGFFDLIQSKCAAIE
jgi:hypothetical protein